jgi:ketosteroid isomerase-like protein
MGKSEAEIRKLIDERIDAIRNKDARTAVEFLAGDVVSFEMVGRLALPAGAARNEEAFAGWLASFQEIDVEVRDLTIEADDRVAFAHSLHRLAGTRVDGRKVNVWMRSTFCFRRDGEGWKIAHAHTSVPFHPGPRARAALDLKP